MTSEFGGKDMMLWRGSSFVFTEDETLWIASIPIWYDVLLKGCCEHPQKITLLPTEVNLAHRLYHERPN